MKVINYGPGYKPKVLACVSCMSEFEYSIKDVKPGRRLVVDKASSEYKEIVGAYVQCPVCYHCIALEEIEYPYYKDESPKKRKWFSRKEK